MNIYVANLPYSTSDDDLREQFEAFGSVESATVIKDRDTGRSRGFGFVEMTDQAEGQAAIDQLNGTEMNGRPLTVNEARPRTERPAAAVPPTRPAGKCCWGLDTAAVPPTRPAGKCCWGLDTAAVPPTRPAGKCCWGLDMAAVPPTRPAGKCCWGLDMAAVPPTRPAGSGLRRAKKQLGRRSGRSPTWRPRS